MKGSKKNEFIEDEIAFVTFVFEESSGIFEAIFGPMLMKKVFSSSHMPLQFVLFLSAVRIILQYVINNFSLFRKIVFVFIIEV